MLIEKKEKKPIFRILQVIVIIIGVVMLMLLTNNALYRYRYSQMDTHSDSLTNMEISQAVTALNYIKSYGEEIYPGFSTAAIDLIIYNDSYEFLICSITKSSEWTLVADNTVPGKSIYRRPVLNPQAFAVDTADRWVGSMSTLDTLNTFVFNSMSGETGVIGYFIPPQLFSADSGHYTGMVIHEMTHAYQAQQNEVRVKADKSIEDINRKYTGEDVFEELIRKEGKYLQMALDASGSGDIIKYARLFLDTRTERRAICGMSAADIHDEAEYEWLEGMARYAEYMSSFDSSSLMRKNLGNVGQKAGEQSDDRYYAMGMAQAMLLDKLNNDWKSAAFSDVFTFENALAEAVDL